MKFHVVNLGCKVNRVEADSLAAALIARGAFPSSEGQADLVVINTCTVTGEADKKARKAVRHALEASPQAVVVATGCAVAIEASTFEALGDRVRAVPKARLLTWVEERFPETTGVLSVSDSDVLRLGGDFRTRVGIKVQDGCDHACTYCIVHVARGPASSTPFDAVLEEAREYLGRGVKELVLTGIDLASYRDGSKRLADLAAAILEEADRACPPGGVPARVRASSIEPQTLDDRFIDLLASSGGRLCRHLHLPLQSGSSKVLREMARPYDAARFAETVTLLRDRVPELSLTTDVIAGFPGETDYDFEQTLAIARASRFSKMHVFPYSPRRGTPAARRSDQVDPQVKAERAARLRTLSEELRAADLAARAGTVELALVEGDVMLTESYHELPALPDAAAGSLVSVSL